MLSIARSAASRAREKNLGPANAADSLKNRGRKGARKLDRVGVKGSQREQKGTNGNTWTFPLRAPKCATRPKGTRGHVRCAVALSGCPRALRSRAKRPTLAAASFDRLRGRIWGFMRVRGFYLTPCFSRSRAPTEGRPEPKRGRTIRRTTLRSVPFTDFPGFLNDYSGRVDLDQGAKRVRPGS